MRTLAPKSIFIYLVLMLLVYPLRVLAEEARYELVQDDSTKVLTIAETSEVKPRSEFTKIYDKELKRQRTIKDGVIIKFVKEATEEQAQNFADQNSLKLVSRLGDNSYLAKVMAKNVDAELSTTDLLNQVNQVNATQARTLATADINIVEWVDVNEYKQITAHLVETPESKKEWHLNNNGVNGLKSGADIKAVQAWTYSKGYGVKVAVIDTGFDVKNPDINFADVSFNALSIDENGKVVDPNGEYDAAAPSYSNENHGTAVAGIIAAKDNGKGVVGVAPEAEVIPIRLINDYGTVSSAQIIAAHRKADELGAQIINNSWGSYDPGLAEGVSLDITSAEEGMYRDIAANGNNGRGILVIFAAGNSGAKNFNNAPEARQDYVMAVGATDSTDQRASYSVYGSELDVVAPGGGAQSIVTTDRRDQTRNVGGKLKVKVKGYAKGSITETFRGTSAAAPVVAGVAALVWSLNPKFTAAQVREFVETSADKNINARYLFDSSTKKNTELGYGRVNAEAAVKAAVAALD